MSHLGPLLSALVDGQLPPAEAERVLAHVAACPPCADELASARAARAALAGACDVVPDPRLTARLLALGAVPPVSQRPTPVVPGSASVPLPGAVGFQPTLSGDLRPRRRPLLPVAASVAGVGLIAACFALGGEPEVALEARQASALSVLTAAAAPAPAADTSLDEWFADNPWAVEVAVPEAHEVVAVRTGDGELEVDLKGPDGLVVVHQTRGRLAGGGVPVVVAGREVRQISDDPTCLAWQSGDAVVMAVAEGPRWALDPVVAAYPVQSYDDRASARFGRGWQVLMTVWSGS